MLDQRVCRKCGSTNFGPSGRCRPCRAAVARERLKDPEARERAKAAGRKHWTTDRRKEKRAAYLADPKVRERCRGYVAKHRQKPEAKAKAQERHKAWYAQPEVKARIQAYNKARQKEYYARPEVKERKAAYELACYQASGQRRVYRSITSEIWNALRKEKDGTSWEILLGYTRKQLVVHLEKQFTRGMSWANYGRGAGKWHVDHITPVSAFSFTTRDDPELRICWGLANLRPMWGAENIAKGGRRTHLL